jgi:hypothetical protein
MKNKEMLFLLDVVPLAELTDTLSNIIEKYRYSSISKEESIKLLKEQCGAEISKIISTNEKIYEECSGIAEAF